MNNEVIFLFLCSLLEIICILFVSSVFVLHTFETIEVSQVRLIAIGFLAIIILAIGVAYRNTIRGGIHCFLSKKWYKYKNQWTIFPVVQTEIKRESHYLSKSAGDRYHRYYLLIQWEDTLGKKHMGRSNYLYEWEKNQIEGRRIHVYVNPQNMHQYICEI